MEASAVLASLLHELEVSEAALSLLLAHARSVVRDADRLGLIAERDVGTVLRRHTADSLLLACARRPVAGERWVDVGSGAGFPGLVLACAFPGTSFLLSEPQQRRAGFLELQALTLGLGHVTVTRDPAERLADACADVVVARALEAPERSLPALRRLLRPGGAALIAAAESTPVPAGARRMRLSRPHVDSPGLVLMIPAIP